MKVCAVVINCGAHWRLCSYLNGLLLLLKQKKNKMLSFGPKKGAPPPPPPPSLSLLLTQEQKLAMETLQVRPNTWTFNNANHSVITPEHIQILRDGRIHNVNDAASCTAEVVAQYLMAP